jgi:DNA-binding LytR/AlgR family response regulator
MSVARPTALVADDEPLLRRSLRRLLGEAWPELEVVAEARNGREAIEQFEALTPDVCFLDVHMPGLSGVEAARQIGNHAHLVFVTAHDQYAVQAFEQGALDYLVKPLPARLAETVARLKARLVSAPSPPDIAAMIAQLAAVLDSRQASAPLRWIRASIGSSIRLIPIDEVDFLRSDEKYTRVAWRGDQAGAGEALIRTPMKKLIAQLDPAQFVQVHRSVVVYLHAISHISRGANETAEIHLKGRDEALPVSSTYLHLFRQM